MFEFIKKLFSIRKKDDKQASQKRKLKDELINKQDDFVLSHSQDSSNALLYSEDEVKDIVLENSDYDYAIRIADKIHALSGFRALATQLKNTVLDSDKATFTKADLADFLSYAETAVTEVYTETENKKAHAAATQESVLAAQDLFRIEKLISDAKEKVKVFKDGLVKINEKVSEIKDCDEIMDISEDFSESYTYLKDISYALKFTYERVDILVDRDSEYESLKFYADRYTQFSSVYGGLTAKVASLKSTKDSLDNKLESYTRQINSKSKKNIINYDITGQRTRKLNQTREQLVEGYTQVEKGCELANTNVTTIIENLLKGNDDVASYLSSLAPKLVKNVEIVKDKYNELKNSYDKMISEIENESKSIRTAIELFNSLYA